MTLKVHHLRPAPGAKTAKTRKGRGEASKGKTAGRGTKGSHARGQVSAAFEGGQTPLVRRLPKFGFTNPTRVEYKGINLDALQALVDKHGVKAIDPQVMRENGLIAKNDLVKILGRGELKGAYDVKAHAFSATAKSAIEAKGGKVETVNR